MHIVSTWRHTALRAALSTTFALATALPVSAATTIDFTGSLANAITFPLTAGDTRFDFWSLTLDTFTPFSVMQGDDIVATVTLDGPYTLPTSSGPRFLSLFFRGPAFSAGDTGTSNITVVLFDGINQVASIGPQISLTSGQVVAGVSTPPNDVPISFDKAMFSFSIQTLDAPTLVEGAGFDAVLTSPVPEPQFWALLAAGLGMLALARRRAAAVG